jgi:hypothetical protein
MLLRFLLLARCSVPLHTHRQPWATCFLRPPARTQRSYNGARDTAATLSVRSERIPGHPHQVASELPDTSNSVCLPNSPQCPSSLLAASRASGVFMRTSHECVGFAACCPRTDDAPKQQLMRITLRHNFEQLMAPPMLIAHFAWSLQFQAGLGGKIHRSKIFQ